MPFDTANKKHASTCNFIKSHENLNNLKVKLYALKKSRAKQ